MIEAVILTRKGFTHIGEVGFDLPADGGITVEVAPEAGSIALILSHPDEGVYSTALLSWPAAERLARYLAVAAHRASEERQEWRVSVSP